MVIEVSRLDGTDLALFFLRKTKMTINLATHTDIFLLRVHIKMMTNPTSAFYTDLKTRITIIDSMTKLVELVAAHAEDIHND
jgi:hypothetical protein